jgi:hypothetical protein
MEADWEFEVGGDAPVIDAHWSGFVDLQNAPERALELAEVAQFPALADALAKLNAASSPVWTSKCDVWEHVDLEAVDADELDAPSDCFAHPIGCYIDLLPKSDQPWPLPDVAANQCRQVCNRLHEIPLRCCRVDLVIRRAFLVPDVMDLGITAYLTSCGASSLESARTLSAALAAFPGAINPRSTSE